MRGSIGIESRHQDLLRRGFPGQHDLRGFGLSHGEFMGCGQRQGEPEDYERQSLGDFPEH